MKKFLLLIMMIVILGGCDKSAHTVQQADPEYIYNKVLEKSIFYENKNILASPAGIACDNEFIYIANQEKDNIIVLNYSGELVHEFGETGQATGQFMSPEAITVTDDFIYIAERDSCRIQIFNKNYEFQKEISIEKLKNDINIQVSDIEVDIDSNIYLSVKGTKSKLLQVYKINSDNNVKELGKNMIGVFGKDKDGTIYFAQSFEVIKNGYQSGDSYVSIVGNKLNKLFDLPYKYSPTSICVIEDKIYIFSYYRCQIDEFSKDGIYLQTLYHEDATVDNMQLKYMAYHDGIFFMTDSKKNTVYAFKYKE